MTHFEKIAVVVHHEQNHQVYLPFGEPPAEHDGTRERPFQRHSVLDLTGESFEVNKNKIAQTGTRSCKQGARSRSPPCGVWPPVVWLRPPWISGAGAAPPCCGSPAASGSAAEPPELALASRWLTTEHGQCRDENTGLVESFTYG